MNEIFVDVADNLNEKPPLSPDELVSIAEFVLNKLEMRDMELSIVICDDETLRELNREYRGKDESTDVLSFAQQNIGIDHFPPEPQLLGDIVISLDTLKRNSEYFTVPVHQELTRLLIHGILHLAGMDHDTNDAVEPMLILQEELLQQVQERDDT
jgi:probable rRNA maturation factor